MTIAVITEPFPNNFNNYGGKFLEYQFAELQKHAKVICIVPLRLTPPRKIFESLKISNFLKNFRIWRNGISGTKSYTSGNLSVYYIPYIGLPRPKYEYSNLYILNFFLYPRVSSIFRKQKPDVVYLNWLTPCIKLARALSLNFNIPLIIDNHATINGLQAAFPDKDEFSKILSELKYADRIIVHSIMNKQDLDIEAGKINISLPPIDVICLGQTFEVTAKPFTNFKDPIKLVTVSHLADEGKNVRELILAMDYLNTLSTNNKFTLDIVGSGTLLQDLENLASKLNLNTIVTFLGNVENAMLEKLLLDYDIFVYPSYRDSFAIVLLEALAKGLPVIAYRQIGATVELVKLGDCVYLLENTSHESIAKAILNVSNNPEAAYKMVCIGQDILKRNFTWERNVNATLAMLNDVIRN